MPGDPQSVLDTLDAFGRHHDFLMNVGDQKGVILDKAMGAANAKRVVELGCFCGYSAVRIARLLPDDGELISIEPKAEYLNVARDVVEFAGLSDKVRFLAGTASEVLPTLEGSFDLVFIDHVKEAYLPDLELIEAKHLITPGSIVVADNVGYFRDTLQVYLDYVRSCGRYESTFYEAKLEYSETEEDGVEVSRRL
jgi:catechol O-methyltransferase|tara:strand:- start:145 stop:729 length:585 start_codon:yes stop_codon:yes gene_type:complete